MNVLQSALSERQANTAGFFRDGFTGPIRLFTSPQCALIVESLRVGTHPAPMDWPKGRAANDRFFFDLATRPMVLTLLKPLLGDNILLWSIDVVERDPGQIHPWHSDIESSAPGGGFVSIWIGIQNTCRESALGMVARSHNFGKTVQQVLHERGLRRDQASDETVLAWAHEFDPLAAFIQPEMTDGDAIIYDGRLWHATNNSRSQGRRIALLLQYAAADRPVWIPDFTEPIWPFHFRELRPPTIVVTGRGDETVNRLVPPPPGPDNHRVVTSFVHEIDLPLPEDKEHKLRRWAIFNGSTSMLNFMEIHYSVLSAEPTPHPPHRHADESLAIMLDGKLDIEVSESPTFENPNLHRLVKNSILYQPAYQYHRLRNSSGSPASYLLFAWRGPALETDCKLVESLFDGADVEASGGPEARHQKLLFEWPTSYLTKLHAHLTTLQPGAGYAPHVDEYDVAIVVLSGKVETLGKIVQPQSFTYYAAGEPHGIKNVGNEPARYLVFEFHAPRRSFRDRVSFRIPSQEQIVGQPAEQFHTFWAGAPLSAYEELGLASLLARGQRIRLYSYDKALRVPDGVERVDANEVLPADRIFGFVHPNGETSPTLHANLFRYEALRRFGGWYCDLDIVLVGDHPPVTDVYFAREDKTFVNNAVLRFPPGAPLMVAAAEAARGFMASAEWGVSGPKLLTRLIEEHGLSQMALPWTAAYPVRTTEVAQLFLPEHREELEDRAAGADFVHLWNQIWRRVRIPKELGPPEGSFLDSLFRSFGIRVAPAGRMSAQAVASWFHEFNVIADARRVSGNLSTIAELTHALEHARVKEADNTRLAEITAKAAELRWERDQLLKSTSWRVTAPLRVISQALRDLRGRS